MQGSQNQWHPENTISFPEAQSLQKNQVLPKTLGRIVLSLLENSPGFWATRTGSDYVLIQRYAVFVKEQYATKGSK